MEFALNLRDLTAILGFSQIAELDGLNAGRLRHSHSEKEPWKTPKKGVEKREIGTGNRKAEKE
jgi:hypothetical protein